MNVPDDDDLTELLGMLESAEAAPPEPQPTPVAAKPAPAKAAPKPKPTYDDDDGDDPAAFLAATGIKAERDVPDITKPWMRFHDFVLVKTPEEVEAIVDEALACGHVSLDLETEGLDNRIVYDEQGKPRTVHQIVGFCLSVGDAKKGYYIPVRHAPNDGGPDLNVKPLARVEAAITRLCQAAQPTPKPGQSDPLAFKDFETPPRVVIDFWNAKFDQEFLYPVTGIDFWHPDSFEDGNLAYFTLYSGDKHLGLKPKSAEVLRSPEGHPYEMIELKELFPNKRKILFPSLSPDEPGVVKYAGSDAICTRLLCGRPDLLPVIAKDPGKAFTYRLEKQVAQVVRVMERNRVKVDRDKLQELRDKHRTVREEYRAKIIALAASKGFENFEPGSPKQLSDFLFGERGLNINPKPPLNEKSGQYKTDYDSMHQLTEELGENAPEVIKWIMAYREEDKVLGTYLESLAVNPDPNNELRFQFKQTGAATGRFSAPAGDNDQGFSGIPIHGIPATSDLRTCFVARPGYTMVKCDYAGEELRIVTNLSNEPVWVKEFQEGDGDLHSITARAFFGKQEVTKEERKMGKVANFALVYGGGPASIMRATGCNKLEAQRRKQAFDKAVPTFANWVKGQHERVKKQLGVYTAFGRWVAIPDANAQLNTKDSNGRMLVTEDDVRALRAACERHATNYPIQGSGADIMKIAMVLLHKEFHRRGWLRHQSDAVRMLLTVHDEIVFEVRHDLVFEAIPVLTEEMEKPTKMARLPYSPKWKVPLVTEPLLGESWGAEYSCHRAKPDEKPKEGGFVAYGYVYGKVPEAIRPFIPADGAAPPPAPEAPAPSSSPTPPEPASSPVAASVPPPAPAPARGPEKVAVSTIRLNTTTAASVSQVRGHVARWMVKSGTYLRLLDKFGTTVLIDPMLKIRVDAQKLAQTLLEANLSDGKVSEETS